MEQRLVRENRILCLITAKLDEEKSCLNEKLAEMTEKAARIEANCAHVVAHAQTVLRLLYPRLELQRERVAFLRKKNKELKEKNTLLEQRTKDLQEAICKLEFAEIELEKSNETVRELSYEKKLLKYENINLKNKIKVFSSLSSFKSQLDKLEERVVAYKNSEPQCKVANHLVEERLIEMEYTEIVSEGTAAKRKQNLQETGPSESKKSKFSVSSKSHATHLMQTTQEGLITSTVSQCRG